MTTVFIPYIVIICYHMLYIVIICYHMLYIVIICYHMLYIVIICYHMQLDLYLLIIILHFNMCINVRRTFTTYDINCT